MIHSCEPLVNYRRDAVGLISLFQTLTDFLHHQQNRVSSGQDSAIYLSINLKGRKTAARWEEICRTDSIGNHYAQYPSPWVSTFHENFRPCLSWLYLCTAAITLPNVADGTRRNLRIICTSVGAGPNVHVHCLCFDSHSPVRWFENLVIALSVTNTITPVCMKNTVVIHIPTRFLVP